jgi:hypothetical protein
VIAAPGWKMSSPAANWCSPYGGLAADGLEAWAEVIDRGLRGVRRQGRGERVGGRSDEAVVEGQAEGLDGQGGRVAAVDFRGRQAMMQRARRASLVVVLLLLTSVGTASAECAWVLWKVTVLSSGDEVWGVLDAYPPAAGHAGCDQKADDMNRGMKESPSRGLMPTTLLCLPDTIDPRGPKGR